MASLLFGLDVGTTSVAAVALSTDGAVRAAKSREHGADLTPSEDWESLQDPQSIFETACGLLGELEAEAGTPDALGVCCQMHGAVYTGPDGKAVSPLYTWLDGRGDLPAVEFGGGESYAARLSRLSSRALSTGFGAVTHHVLSQWQHVPKNAGRLMTIGDYVAARLCGATRPLTDATPAHSLGIYDAAEGRWDENLCELANLGPELLPEVVPSGAILGEVGETFGSIRRRAPGGGKPAGIPVAVATGDNPAGFLGTVGDPTNTAALSIGTSGQITVLLEEAASIPTVDVRPFPGNRFIGVGASLTGGKSYAILRSFFEKALESFGGGTEAVSYERMNELAAAAYRRLEAETEDEAARNETLRRQEGLELRPQSGPLRDPRAPIVDTRFQGSRVEPDARGRILNLDGANFEPGMLTLAMLGGMVGELRMYYKAFPEQVRRNMSRVAVTGNAIRRNPLLQQIISDYFDSPVAVRRHSEEAAVGAAMVSGVGVGVWPGFLEAAPLVESLQ